MTSSGFVRSVAANIAYWRQHEGLTDPRAWAALDQERENLFRAAVFGLQIDDTFLDAAELIRLAYTYVFERGYSREWIPIMERAIVDCPDDQLKLKASLLHHLGSLYRKNRRLEQAQDAHLQEEELRYRMEDQTGLALAHLGLGRIYYRRRQHATAEAYGLKALSGLQSGDGTLEQIANAFNLLGITAQAQGNLPESETYLRQAISFFGQAGNQIEEARSQANLSLASEGLGQIEATLDLLGQAMLIFEAYDLHLECSRAYNNLGAIHYRQGELAQAEAAFRKANSPAMRRSGPIYFRMQTEMNLGNVLLEQGHFEEARAYLLSCVDGFRLVDAKTMLANSLDGLAETSLELDDRQEAIALYEEALSIVAAIPEDAWANRMEKRFRGLLQELASQSEEEE